MFSDYQLLTIFASSMQTLPTIAIKREKRMKDSMNKDKECEKKVKEN